MLRNPNGGAVATIAASRTTYATGNIMIKGYLDCVLPDMDSNFGSDDSNHRLGDMLNHGRLYMLEKYGFNAGVINHFGLYQLFGDPTLEMWVKPPAKLRKDIVLIPKPDYLEIHYAEEGATITALQETETGLRSIGRGVVKRGMARLEIFQAPSPRVAIRFSASLPNAISTSLTDIR